MTSGGRASTLAVPNFPLNVEEASLTTRSCAKRVRLTSNVQAQAPVALHLLFLSNTCYVFRPKAEDHPRECHGPTVAGAEPAV